jgi:hypothetical protein
LPNYVYAGGISIKAFGIPSLLILLTMVSYGADWLEGGYVSGGGNSEIGQYFTDPIFSSSGGHYLSSDPATREMQESMDRPISLGSVVSRPATSVAGAASIQTANAAGRWSMSLSDGRSIYLELYQSGTRIFGRGSMTTGQKTQGALASGTVTGSTVILDVVPESGIELYSISLDISRLHLSSSFHVFRYGGQIGSGTVRATRTP